MPPVCFAFEDGRKRCVSERAAERLAAQLQRRLTIPMHVASLADAIASQRHAGTYQTTDVTKDAIETTPEQKQALLEALSGVEWPEEDAEALQELRIALTRFGSA